nr:hypothetical protein [Salmonella enterica]
MRRILATTAALCLGGCITVYGPVKTGGQQQQGSQTGQQPVLTTIPQGLSPVLRMTRS